MESGHGDGHRRRPHGRRQTWRAEWEKEVPVRINEVIDRALKDPVYASELAAKAGRVSRAAGGVTSDSPRGDEWRVLLAEFADGPEELARLIPTDDPKTMKEGITTATTGTTTTTITTTTTLPCAITTTTTTTTTTTITTTL
jgi:hypothetical protein